MRLAVFAGRERGFFCALLALFATADQELLGQSDPGNHRQSYRITYVQTPPVIDGDLSDPVWQRAAIIDDFRQQVPVFGAAASERTEFRMVYDLNALYVSFYCYDSDPSAIRKTLLSYRDDDVWMKDDFVRVVLDTYHDHRRGYVFTASPLATKQDAQIDNNVWNSSWDEVWDVRTRLQEDGWSAEFRIPFRILRFPVGKNPVWGFNAERMIKRKNERMQWAVIPAGLPSTRTDHYGHLEGLAGIEKRRNFQLIPYITGGTFRKRGEDAEYPEVAAGGDAKITLTPTLAMDLTYNTNFAQVEADDRQVNLPRFPLFFPEKREFFLENAQLFDFGIPQELQLFFSRRIGLQGGEPIPLHGGARLTGRAGALDLGLLTTQTKSHKGRPGANLSAARVRWNIRGRSHAGGIFTSLSSGDAENRAFGPDVLLWLGRNLSLDGFLAVIDDRGLKRTPAAFTSALVYNQDLWEFNLRTLRVGRDFNPALGFVRRAEIQRNDLKLRRGWRLNRRYARKVDLTGQLRYVTDLDGRLDTRLWLLEGSNELDSGDVVWVRAELNFERLDADEEPFRINPRENVIVPPGDYAFNRWAIAYEGYTGRPFSSRVQLQGGRFYGGERTGLLMSVTWRAIPQFILAADYELNDVALHQGDFTTHLWRGRLTLPLRPRLLLDTLVQWNGLLRELAAQVRFHLIYGDDSNLFLVFSDGRTEDGGRLVRQSQDLQIKLTYRMFW
ncbi:MAG: carbohydrate binding family 9 domain-containing protein [Acidobacteria bacterium]|nr:carbohydrate binding family 9 domain-containing protein [Acidobacteriota bacterium]